MSPPIVFNDENSADEIAFHSLRGNLLAERSRQAVPLGPKSTDRIPRLLLGRHASSGMELMCPEGYAKGQLITFTSPAQLDLSVPDDDGFFSPFTTTLLKIGLNREPFPLDQVGRILQFL